MAHPVSQYAPDTFRLNETTFTRVKNILMAVGAIGWLLLVIGFFVDHERFHHSYLLNSVYATTFAVGALFFVMIQHLSGATWSVVVRRIAESLMATLPLAFILFLPNLIGLHSIYEWTHADVVANDYILSKKTGYLNEPFFIARTLFYFGVWIFFAWKLWNWSVAQDTDRRFDYTEKSRNLSAFGVLALTATFGLASMDWVMTLMPHWFSTMFGVYMYAGCALSFTGLMILICLQFRANGILANAISEEHYHDLGKWLFAFNTFWAYCAFSQYMLIWYGNLTEETIFFRHRFQGSWEPVSHLLIIGHFFVPFGILLGRWAKRRLALLGLMSAWLLAMHYVDIYWLIMGSLYQGGIQPHWLDAAGLLAMVGTFGTVFWIRLAKQSMVPVGDLRFERSLNFHQV